MKKKKKLFIFYKNEIFERELATLIHHNNSCFPRDTLTLNFVDTGK